MKEPILIVFPKTTTFKSIPIKIDRILEDFSTNKQVKEYEVDCYCASEVRHLCIVCKNTGRRISVSNPKGHWSYWSIGGSWSGEILGLPREEVPQPGLVALNTVCTKQLAKQKLFVTTLIDWQGNLEDLELATQPDAICEKYTDHLFVVVTCHT